MSTPQSSFHPASPPLSPLSASVGIPRTALRCRVVITDSVELSGGDLPDARVRAGDDGDLAVQPGLTRAFAAEHVSVPASFR